MPEDKKKTKSFVDDTDDESDEESAKTPMSASCPIRDGKDGYLVEVILKHSRDKWIELFDKVHKDVVPKETTDAGATDTGNAASSETAQMDTEAVDPPVAENVHMESDEIGRAHV
mgnify:CR=1 FL=1